MLNVTCKSCWSWFSGFSFSSWVSWNFKIWKAFRHFLLTRATKLFRDFGYHSNFNFHMLSANQIAEISQVVVGGNSLESYWWSVFHGFLWSICKVGERFPLDPWWIYCLLQLSCERCGCSIRYQLTGTGKERKGRGGEEVIERIDGFYSYQLRQIKEVSIYFCCSLSDLVRK